MCFEVVEGYVIMFLFVKQKAAYGLRISDWSSDVCSSDLELGGGDPVPFQIGPADLKDHFAGLVPQGLDVVFAKHLSPILRRSITLFAELKRRETQDGQAHAPFVAFHNPLARMEGSEEHPSDLQSLMRNSYAVFCMNKKTHVYIHTK